MPDLTGFIPTQGAIACHSPTLGIACAGFDGSLWPVLGRRSTATSAGRYTAIRPSRCNRQQPSTRVLFRRERRGMAARRSSATRIPRPRIGSNRRRPSATHRTGRPLAGPWPGVPAIGLPVAANERVTVTAGRPPGCMTSGMRYRAPCTVANYSPSQPGRSTNDGPMSSRRSEAVSLRESGCVVSVDLPPRQL